jgi:apolipoprotein D and lipocalin family protein
MLRTLILALALGAACPTLRAQDAPLPNASVPALDLQRYAGDWHEVAHLPMFFQRHCVAHITATYTLRADGRIDVRNACADEDGKLIASDGVARPVTGHPGRLQVRFAPDWLAWAPLVWADYWVVELDPDYRWAVVGGPDRKYLWVLSRTPGMERAQFEAIKARAARRGYPVQDLVMAAPLRD